MAQFSVLKGKGIAKAIAGFGAKAATFSQLMHQIAYSALNHVEEHHDACYVQQFYDAAPVNYRAMLVTWFTNFGRVSFDAKALTFTYAKSKKSDMDGALAVSPAEFQKESKGGAAKEDTVEKVIASMMTRLEAIRDKGTKIDPRIMQAAKGLVLLAEGKAGQAPAELVKSDKAAKAKKAKPAPAATQEAAAA